MTRHGARRRGRSVTLAAALVLGVRAVGGAAPSPTEALRAELGRRDPAERVALIDLVKYRDAGGRDRFRAELARLGGEIVWAGRMDQEFIGHGDEDWDDVLVTEFSSARGLLAALAGQSREGADSMLERRRTYPATPWRAYARVPAAAAFRILNLVGGGPPPLDLAAGAERFDASKIAGTGDDSLGPTAEQVRTLAQSGLSTRAVMVNFLRYTAPHDGRGGEYDTYARSVALILGRLGGRIRWMGWPYAGADAEAWDAVALVEHPSRAAFLGMLAAPEYRALIPERAAGLASTKLLVCTSWPEFYEASTGSGTALVVAAGVVLAYGPWRRRGAKARPRALPDPARDAERGKGAA